MLPVRIRLARPDFSTTQPRWPRTRPPRTWNTCTAASSSSSANATTSASVPSPNTTVCFSSARLQRPDVVAQPGGPLEVELLGRGGHLLFHVAGQPVGLARQEVAEVEHDPAVLLGADPTDARRRALVDVAEQARPVNLVVPLEHSGRAGARRKHPGQQVERLADGPRMRVRPEVAHALAARTAVDEQSRDTPR